jgi:hypothetical protein
MESESRAENPGENGDILGIADIDVKDIPILCAPTGETDVAAVL